MRARLINVGEKILEFLKTVDGCENVVFEKIEDHEYVEFEWDDHHFLMRLERRGGAIRLGEVKKHGRHQDADMVADIGDVPFLGIDGVGPIGRISSQCSVDILYVTKGAGKGGRNQYKRVLWFENPSEVHLLPPECVKKLDEILIQDIIRFLKHHFRVWRELGDLNLDSLIHPRACW